VNIPNNWTETPLSQSTQSKNAIKTTGNLTYNWWAQKGGFNMLNLCQQNAEKSNAPHMQ
jgi:hypothetical protein